MKIHGEPEGRLNNALAHALTSHAVPHDLTIPTTTVDNWPPPHTPTHPSLWYRPPQHKGIGHTRCAREILCLFILLTSNHTNCLPPTSCYVHKSWQQQNELERAGVQGAPIKFSFNMITDYSNYTNRTKTPTGRGLILLIMLCLPASPLFTSISTPAGGEISLLSPFTSILMRNPSTSPVHHDFNTSRWGNPSATLFTSISMGEPLRRPRSPQFWCQQVEEPLHRLCLPEFWQGNPYITQFQCQQVEKPLHCCRSSWFRWATPPWPPHFRCHEPGQQYIINFIYVKLYLQCI